MAILKTKVAIGIRWTPFLAQSGFVPIPMAFLRFATQISPPLQPAEMLLVVVIQSHRWDSRLPYPSSRKLAEFMGCTDRYVRKLCAQLEANGYLNRRKGPGRSLEYDFGILFSKLEQKMQETLSASRV